MGKTINLRTIAIAALTAVLAMSLFAGAAIAKQPDKAERGNSLRSEATLIDLEEGDVEIQVSDESAANFDEEFTYYVVRGLPEYDRAIYREPARLGGQNVELGGWDGGSFWFGVTAPDENGIQHPIEHKGQVSLYLEVDGEWQWLKVQFNGKGELLSVNGVEPEE